MSGLRVALVVLCLAAASAPGAGAAAQAEAVEARGPAHEQNEDAELELSSPYAPAVREHFYQVLSRSPTKAFLWELALPGAGHFYNGFPIQAGVAIGLTCAGAALWIAGAVRDQDALWWTGIGTFAAGRLYGLISAPVTAVLLNAAYRRQLGIVF